MCRRDNEQCMKMKKLQLLDDVGPAYIGLLKTKWVLTQNQSMHDSHMYDTS
jgi:hypothetical protein